MRARFSKPLIETRFRTYVWIIVLLAASGLGMYLIKETTQFGASLHADSFSYLTAAEQLANSGRYGRISGLGEFRPITHFPPMYSIAVAMVQKIGLAGYPSARVLNSVLFGFTILAIGLGIVLVTRSLMLSIFGALLTAASPVLIDMYSWAHSEPLYIFLSVGFLIGLTWLIRKSESRYLLVLSALFAGAAILTRYIGISLLPVGFVGLLIFTSARDRKSRWRDALSFLILSIIPVGFFLIRNYVLTGNATNRPAPFWHPPNPEEWAGAINVMLEWFLPNDVIVGMQPIVNIITFISLIFAIGLLTYFSFGPRTARGRSTVALSSKFISILLIYLLTYLILVVMAVLFFDTMTLLNQRILSPIYLPGLLLIIVVVWRWWEKSAKWLRFFIGFFGLVLLGYQIFRSSEMVGELRSAPRGYASGIYRNSLTIEYVRQLPDVPIYSNDLPALYFWADRMAIYIPSRINPSTLVYDSVEKYELSLQKMYERMDQEDAVLVIFGPDPYSRLDQNHLSDLTRDLVLMAEFKDGLVFHYNSGD